MIETITSDEFIAEMLPQWLIKEMDEMIIYISDGTEGPCDEEAEDECPQEEEE
jgi:hypothetical protein